MVVSILILFIVMSCLFIRQGKASVIVCNSISCKHNKLCRCTRANIAVYDNTVAGLCLYHTNSMDVRVIEPMKKALSLERYQYETYVATDGLGKRQEEIREAELLENPNTFGKWLKTQFKKKSKERAHLVFRYYAKDGKGTDRNGEVAAMNRKDAIGKLQKQGLYIISLDEVA